MPMVFVRAAQDADLDLIVRWWEELARLHAAREGALLQPVPDAAELTRSHFRELLGDPDALVAVAELEGATVGFANAERRARPPVLQPRRMLHLDNLYVREDARRKGVASALLARCREWAQERGLELWSATVYRWNEAALALCARAGLEPQTVGLVGRVGGAGEKGERGEPFD